MSARKKKTTLRTIRLSEDIDDLLERDALEQNISANALVGKIMAKYVEWDRIVGKMGFFYVSNIIFGALVNEVSEERLAELARDISVKDIKDIAMWAYGKTDYDAVLNALFLMSKYGISAPLSAEIKVGGPNVITLHHNWGQKGVIFFRSYFDNLVRKELGKQPTISVTNDVVTVSFP